MTHMGPSMQVTGDQGPISHVPGVQRNTISPASCHCQAEYLAGAAVRAATFQSSPWLQRAFAGLAGLRHGEKQSRLTLTDGQQTDHRDGQIAVTVASKDKA